MSCGLRKDLWWPRLFSLNEKSIRLKEMQDTCKFLRTIHRDLLLCDSLLCHRVYWNWEWQQRFFVAAIKKPITAVWKYLQCKLKPILDSLYVRHICDVVWILENLASTNHPARKRLLLWHFCKVYNNNTGSGWGGNLLTVAGNLADVSVGVGNNIFWEGVGEVGWWRGMFCHIVDL